MIILTSSVIVLEEKAPSVNFCIVKEVVKKYNFVFFEIDFVF